MKKLYETLTIVVTVILCSQSILNAQTNSSKNKQNQLYFELLGSGISYSINYERLLSESFTLRAGFGYTPGLIIDGDFIQIPVTASYLIGSETSKLEIGLGGTFFTGTDTDIFSLETGDLSIIFINGILGYRYVSSSGFVFRIAFTPLYSSETDPNFLPYGGLSVGFMF